jgi:hypothetical protein
VPRLAPQLLAPQLLAVAAWEKLFHFILSERKLKKVPVPIVF